MQAAIDPETYFDTLPETVCRVVRAFVQDVSGLGGELQWRNYGPRVRVRGSAGPKVVASIETTTAYLTVGPLKGLDREPSTRAIERLKDVPGVRRGDTFARISLKSAGRDDVEAFFAVAREFVHELAGSITATSVSG